MLRLAGVILLALISAAVAVQPGEQLADPRLELRAREISAGLRCLVCQNQSIDDSDAPLARDLRILVRQRLQAGDSDADVSSYLVARYGDFILLRPPFTASTLLLWLTPLAVLLAGGLFAILKARQPKRAAVHGLTADEEARLARLIAQGPVASGAAPELTKH